MKYRALASLVVCCLFPQYTFAVSPETLPPFELQDTQDFSTPGALSNSWADYDLDGDLDLLVTFKSGEVRLYNNQHGTFHIVSAELGLPQQGSDARGASWGDFNQDGYPDLFIGTFQRPHYTENMLFINEQGKHFVEVASKLGVNLPGTSARQANWIDYDNDGDLDLYLAQRMGGNRLYKNEGTTFSDASKQAGLYDPRRSVGTCWFDADGDGDLDLFIANQSGDRDGYYLNNNGKFIDVAHENNMDHPLRPLNEGGVGCAVGDFDNDGDFDLFVATYGDDLLYQNDGKGHFAEVSKQWGINGNHHHVTAVWGDVNNDGLLDLYVTGFKGTNIHEADYFYLNNGKQFINVMPEYMQQQDADHSVQMADYDNDGDLDIAFTHNDSKVGYEYLYKNQSANPAHSLKVVVKDSKSHAYIPGAEIRLFDQNNQLLASRMMDTGTGYNAQNYMPVQFGIPNMQQKLNIKVTFMSASGPVDVWVKGISPAAWKGKVVMINQNGLEHN